MRYYNEQTQKTKVGAIIRDTFLGIFLLILFFSSFGTIGAGQRGVLLQFGGVTGKIYSEGLYFKAPFIHAVKVLDIKTQKEQVGAGSASKDLQTVTSVVALNYNLKADKVAKMWQEVGQDYKSRIIDPAIQESVKASTAKFTAEELITKRELVREEVKISLKGKLEPYGIVVDDLNIIAFDFSQSFNQAIEAKVTAEQSALAAKNKLEQVKFEAQQAIESAQGRAKAIQIEGEALNNSPQVTELRYIEKWDGKMPIYWGGATPFVGLPQK